MTILRRGPRTCFVLAAAAAATWLTYPQDARPRTQTSQAIPRAATALSLSIAATEQSSCEKEARDEFHREGWDNEPSAALIAHYNVRLKQCFQEIVYISRDGEGRSLVIKTLGDTRGREYADFLSSGKSGYAPAENRPALCELILSSGEQMECNSPGDFDAAVDEYMK
jgi:hypothetical protein